MNLYNIIDSFFTVSVLYILNSCADSSSASGHPQHTCPLWHYYSKTQGTCKCCRGSTLNSHNLNCTAHFLYIDQSYCITWNRYSNSGEIAKCLRTNQKGSNYNFISQFNNYNIPTNITGPELNNVTCSVHNRNGAQCRHCIDGHGPAVFSDGITCADCSQHKHLWVLNLLLQLTMVTILYVIVIVFQINGTSSPFNVFITYSQVIAYDLTTVTGYCSKIIHSTSQKTFLPISTFFGIFSLDFFRFVIPPLCVSTTLKSIHVLLFDYIIAVFPIVITVLIYVTIELHDRNCFIIVFLSSPLRRLISHRNWNPKETILTTCVTFLLLSYSKFLFVSLSLLLFVRVYHCKNGETITNQSLLLYDPTIRFLHSEHIPYVVLALFVIVIFVLLPPLLLLLYPTRLFRKCLSWCGFQRWDVLHLIMDIFQGWYKDGTEGTLDYRCFSSLFMGMRLLFACCISIFLVSSNYTDRSIQHLFIVLGLLHVLLGVVFLTLKPYKIKWMNFTDGALLTVIGVIALTYYVGSKIIYFSVIIFVSLLFLCIICFVIFKCVKKFCA